MSNAGLPGSQEWSRVLLSWGKENLQGEEKNRSVSRNFWTTLCFNSIYFYRLSRIGEPKQFSSFFSPQKKALLVISSFLLFSRLVFVLIKTASPEGYLIPHCSEKNYGFFRHFLLFFEGEDRKVEPRQCTNYTEEKGQIRRNIFLSDLLLFFKFPWD